MGKYLTYGIKGVIVGLAIIGITNMFSTIPNLNYKIEDLQIQNKNMQTKINEYKVAMKFENLFMLGASPKNVMNFEALEKYIKERKEFYEKIQLQKGSM